MIEAEHIERAERLLMQKHTIAGVNPTQRVCAKAKVNPDAIDAFIGHHRDTLIKKYLPDIDPRHDSAIVTMFLHFFCVGATAQRVSEGRS